MEWKQWEGRMIDGTFHLGQYLGGSAHSAVFLTGFGDPPEPAVIKLTTAGSEAAQVWMLRRELAAGLSHPGMVGIRHFGTFHLGGASLAYAVMERTEEDLAQVIPIRPLTPDEAREMLASVLDALAYIHSHGFVHGSLAAANVMATADGIKISSDGLLRIGEPTDDPAARKWTGPPESRAALTPASDVWSVGMLIVEVLTQRAPEWDGSSVNDPVIPDTLEAPFASIARRCLRSDPRQRCSIADIVLALRPASAVTAPAAVPASAVAARPASHPAPRKSRYLVPAAAALFAGAILVFANLNNSKPAAAPAAEPPKPSTVAQAAASEPITAPPLPVPAELPPPVPGQPAATASESAAAPTAEPAAQPSAPAPVTPAPAVSSPVRRASAKSSGDVVDRFVPEVPPQILRTIHGKVKVSVQVTVDRSGAVVDAKPHSLSGSRYFGKLALDAVRHWKFRPAADSPDSALTRLVRFEFRRDGCDVFAD